MGDEQRAQRSLIEGCLAAMGFDPARLGEVRLLRAGISGAAAYRLRWQEMDAFLKITSPEGGRVAMERAAREIAFYRDLAGRLPLRTPRALGMHAGPSGYALLLAAYAPSPPPERWPAARYVEAAHQLGRLHAAYWGKERELAALPWLRRRGPGDDDEDLALALADWRALREQARLAGVLTPPVLRRLEATLARMPAVAAISRALPSTLRHGDANPWNVLLDDSGALVWADWQEVGVGGGPEDLSFLLQQASIAGAAVPYDAALTSYHASLVEGVGDDLPLAAIRRAALAAELWSRLVQWPGYLRHASSAEIGAMVARIRSLADQLDLAG